MADCTSDCPGARNDHRDVGGEMPQDTVVSLGACPDPVKVKFIYVAHLKQRLLTKGVYIQGNQEIKI